MQVYMHCDECANKVSRCLRGFDGNFHFHFHFHFIYFLITDMLINSIWLKFSGVEEIKTDKANNKVIVKGEKADPDEVLKRIQNKYSGNAQLISPKPKANTGVQEKQQSENKNKQVSNFTSPSRNVFSSLVILSSYPWLWMDVMQQPQVKLVILKMFMHCEGCARDIRKYIIRMKGN